MNFEFAVTRSTEAIWILMKLTFSPPLLSVNKTISDEIIVLFDRVRLSKLHNITISVITGVMGNEVSSLILIVINDKPIRERKSLKVTQCQIIPHVKSFHTCDITLRC